jgi:hypothetical protein
MVFRYASGEEVQVGDRVRRTRWFRRPQEGAVVYLHDPKQPSPPNGNNDLGFSVKWDDPSDGWYWSGILLDPKLELVSRGAPAA